MTTKTNRLASGKWARISLGAVVATALTAASVTPAMADDRRHRDSIGAGEIIAGAVVIGGIAALAGAFDGNRGDRRYDNRNFRDRDFRDRDFRDRDFRDRDFRGDRFDRGGFGFNGGPRNAVDRCVRAAENQARRFGGYRYADVIDVRDIDRTRDGFRVRGRIAVEGSPRWGGRRGDRGNFTCNIGGRGAPFVDFGGIRGL